MTVNTVDQLELIVGSVRLPLKIEDSVHYFSLHYFEFQGKRWASAALNDLSELDAVPLRIESACFFGHVMHSQQCDCGFQLDEAFRRIVQRNGGLVIYGIDQDARGLGIEKHFRIYDYRQNHHLDTDEVYKRFHAPLDSRSYEAVAAILRFLDVEKILLMSNNRARLAFLRAEGFQVERDQIEAPLTRYNMATMMLEKEDLAYQWSFKTHSEWLRPLQDKVDGHPDSFAACIVKDNQAVVAEWQGADWNVALNLLATHEGGEDGNLVIYLSDLPRLDELALYASTGARFVVVPFAVIPDYLLSEAQRQGLKLQDWERNNQYRTARPQWRLTEHGRDAHVYQRGDERRVYRAGDAAAD